jgi:hypothetical protein
VFVELIPGLEAMFVRDYGLRVVQGEIYSGQLGDGSPSCCG